MTSVRFCGRDFTEGELELLRALCADRTAYPTRSSIARALCEATSWRDQLGRLKEMSARVALLRMAAASLIELPPPRNGNRNGRVARHLDAAQLSFGHAPFASSLAELGGIELRAVKGRSDSRTWNQLVAAHHYLGYVPLCGAQLRYLVEASTGVIGALSFGPSAWKCRPRDAHIGWDQATREQRLHLVVGNARFLILPQLRVPHLASKILGAATRRLPSDWREVYGYQPVLVERRRLSAGVNGFGRRLRCDAMRRLSRRRRPPPRRRRVAAPLAVRGAGAGGLAGAAARPASS